jgi:hypothetical protein
MLHPPGNHVYPGIRAVTRNKLESTSGIESKRK